jgi:uncharacterized protein (TIGR02246 family)
MRKLKPFALTCCLLVALTWGLILGMGRMNAGPQEPQANAEPEGGKRAQEFIAAFNRGDAKALASFWMPDGNYVDQDGVEVKGREALEKMYENLFAELKGAKLTIKPLSTPILAPSVAIEEGISQINLADGGPPSLARYSAVLVKKDDVWYLESLREAGVKPPSNAEHFAQLDWLIGEWVGENDKGPSGTDTFDWAENQNFIVSSFATTLDGIAVSGGTRWIAWDAATKQVRSWSFYSGGGFSEGIWTKTGNNVWTIKSTATTAAGKKVSATQILTKVDADHCTWQPTNVTVDGQAVPDPATVKFKRVKEDQPPSK